MGESSLQRKLFSRFKRKPARTRTPTLSQEDEMIRTGPTNQKQSHSSQDDQGEEISPAISMDACEQQQQAEEEGEQRESQHRECLESPELQPKQQLSGTRTRAKLKTTSRAIVFFRRAASSLSAVRQAANLAREDTNDSLASSNGASMPTAAGSLSVSGEQQRKASSTANHHQFIVPKLNALKLPLVCLVRSLEGELMREVFVHRYELGSYLIESLKVSLGLEDCKYFGLKLAKGVEDQEDVRNAWLDLGESVCKQVAGSASSVSNLSSSSSSTLNGLRGSAQRSVDFYLRIKFYPPNLARVRDPFLRHYLWLQLRRDLRLGKLTSSMNNLTLLMACVLQFELGDHQPHLLARIPELNILPNQDLIEEQAIEVWRRRLAGTIKHQAQMQFLRAACILETYGFDYYPVRDHQRQRAYLLGFNYAGVKTIRNGHIVHHFRWHSLSKISYERRMIIFHIYPTENSKRKQILGFKCLSNDECQSLYMRLLEQKYFFTVDLAYFDKSARRPSNLLAGDEAPPATLSLQQDWQASSTLSGHQDGQADEGELPLLSPELPLGLGAEQRAAFSQQPACARSSTSASLAGRPSDLSSPSRGQREPPQCANCSTCSGPDPSEGMPALPVGDVPPEVARTGNFVQRYLRTSNSCSRLQRQRSTCSESLDPNWGSNSNSNSNSNSDSNWPANIAQAPPASRPPAREHLGAQQAEASGQRERQPGLWDKMISCIGGDFELAELAESVLVQPAAALQQCRQRHLEANSRLLMPALRFFFALLAINFLLRLTDSLSSGLVEFLTLRQAQPDT